MSAAEPLLRVEDLRVEFPTEDGVVHAVDGITYQVHAGRTLGIVGESGSGKTVSSLTTLGLTRAPGRRDLAAASCSRGATCCRFSEEELRAIRGNDIAMIFQDPLSSLHPLLPGRQRSSSRRCARIAMSRRAQARARAMELLGLVGIPDPARRVDEYPHEFSGGMRQRVMIAMALANEPKLLIADEPTTALDVTVQAQILALLERLQRELGMAIMIITHDLGVVAEMADDIAVMYAGRIVETAPPRRSSPRPQHPYTWGLLRSIPRLDAARARQLVPIPGSPPSLIRPPVRLPLPSPLPLRPARARAHRPAARAGAGRAATTSSRACSSRRARRASCAAPAVEASPTRPSGVGLTRRRRARAHPAEALGAAGRADDAPDAPGACGERPGRGAASAEPLVEVRDLVKHFPITRGVIFQRADRARSRPSTGSASTFGAARRSASSARRAAARAPRRAC